MTRKIGLGFALVGLTFGFFGGCDRTKVDGDVTGVDLTIQYDAQLGLTSLRVSAFSQGMRVLDPVMYPNPARDLSPTEETLVILVPDALAGNDLFVRVDGMVNGSTVLASGGTTVALAVRELALGTIVLGAPAICG